MAVILVVEDEVFTREIAAMMIQDWGHDALSAGDMDGAMQFLRSDQPIDVLFTDIYLKSVILGGCDLAHQAIRLRPDLRILYTTGNIVSDEMRSLFVDGSHCLRKPYTEQQLHDGLLAA